MIKYQSFTKFSIRWSVSRYKSCKEIDNQYDKEKFK